MSFRSQRVSFWLPSKVESGSLWQPVDMIRRRGDLAVLPLRFGQLREVGYQSVSILSLHAVLYFLRVESSTEVILNPCRTSARRMSESRQQKVEGEIYQTLLVFLLAIPTVLLLRCINIHTSGGLIGSPLS